MSTSESVLVLNVDFSPLEVISWRDAMDKILMGKAELVEEYAGRVLRSVSQEWAWPAVIRLIGPYVKRKVRLSRSNILARDGYTCQYCGKRPRRSSGAPKLEDLTIDHVFPKSRAVQGLVVLPWNGQRVKSTSWENLITACINCNAGKANRTPKEAKLKMLSTPRIPTMSDVARMSIFKFRIPEEWKTYLPDDSPWRDYWTVALDDD